MTDAPVLRSIDIDLATNTLRLIVREPTTPTRIETSAAEATIDIGTAGRLVGVELGESYIDVMPPEPGTEHLIRSAPAGVTVEWDSGSGVLVALAVPRRAAGYEITYPSGNQ